MTTWHGILFGLGEKFWSNLRQFTYNNRTAVEIVFILIYALEQVFLIWFTYQSNSLIELSYIISIFAVIVLTTFSLHKLVMESRIKCLEKEVNELQQRKIGLQHEVKEAKKEYQEIYEAIQHKQQDLNIKPYLTYQKRDEHE